MTPNLDYLLTNKDTFSTAINAILKAQKFIKKNFGKAQNFKVFIEQVIDELSKAGQTTPADITEASEEFTRLFQSDMVKHFAKLHGRGQTVKDEYFTLMKNAAGGMSNTYTAH